MDQNGAGTFYYANLAVNKNTGASLGVSVHRGHFTGGTFVWDDVQAFDSPGNVVPNDDFYDKEALVSGKNSNKNDAYVSLTNFQQLCGLQQNGFGQIEVWRTHDGGASWQGPGIAGPEAPDSVAACGNFGHLQQSSAPAVAPNGDVYVIWQYGPRSFRVVSARTPTSCRRSTDGGTTFAPITTVADINSSRNNPPIGYNRARVNDHPRIDSRRPEIQGPDLCDVLQLRDPIGNPSPNVQVLTDIQTYLKYSDDGGATWSTPVAIGGPLPLTRQR